MKLIKYFSAVLLMVVSFSCEKDEAPSDSTTDTDQYSSVMNVWQSHFIAQGSQTGTFSAEFDIVPKGDSIDVVFGMQSNVAATYDDVSTLVRFNQDGEIDVFTDKAFKADAVVTYTEDSNCHFRFDVDVKKSVFDVYVTIDGASEVPLAKEYKFRNFAAFIDQWSVYSSNYGVRSPGEIKISNITVKNNSTSTNPVLMPVGIIRTGIGEKGNVLITAIDPLDPINPLSDSFYTIATGLPEFASFEDQGNGKLLVSYASDSLDVGHYNFNVTVSSSSVSVSSEYQINVTRNASVVSSKADNMANSIGGVEAKTNAQLYIGRFGTYEGAPLPPRDMAAVMPIKLPELEEGEYIEYAEFITNIEEATDWAAQDYDLYGLPYDRSKTVVASDFYQGIYGGDDDAYPLQQRLYSGQSTVGSVVSSDDAGYSIADYINEQFDNGMQQKKYVFFRININVVNAPDWALHKITSADSPDENFRPTLKLYIAKKSE